MTMRILLGLILVLPSLIASGSGANAPCSQKASAQVNIAGLSQFNGTQAGSLVVREGPLLHFMSFCADADYKTPNTVAFRTTCVGRPEQPLFDFILKYEPAKKGYFFSVRTYYLNSSGEFGPAVKDLPVAFVEGTGFSGKGVTTFRGQELKVTVAIRQKETQHHEWEIAFESSDAILFQYKFDSKKVLD